jgi:hypothetical protein
MVPVIGRIEMGPLAAIDYRESMQFAYVGGGGMSLPVPKV